MQLRKNRYASYYDASMDDETLDNELATDTSDGLMSKEDKMKLDSIQIGGSGSVKIPASEIIPDENNQFVTSEDKQKLDSLEVTEDGSIAVPAVNVITNKNQQFVTTEQIKKIESSVKVTYDQENEAFIFE